MKGVFKIIAVATICGALVQPAFSQDRGRNNYNRGTNNGQSVPSKRPSSPQRPGNNQRPGHGNNHRPDQRPGHGNNHRPDQRPGRGNNHRPDQRPGHGNNHRPDYRPDHRPGHNHDSWNHHGVHDGRPHGHYRPGPPPPPAHRPYMPPHHAWYRPAPPPRAYRYYDAWPSFSTILGFRIGSAIASVVNSLAYTNYNVLASTADAVYLTGVPMMNYVWPDAVLTFNSVGRLAGSEFISYSPYADRSLFNRVYRELVLNYGTPYAVNNSGPYGSEVSWWGPDGQYIRLSFSNQSAYDGIPRFYTTLNFGVY